MKEIKNTEPNSLTDRDIEELLYIMNNTEYTNLRGKIAIKLSDTQKQQVLPNIIKLIKKNINTHFIGSLIYACENFDCYEYLELFVDIIIVKDDMTVLDAYSVIQSIKTKPHLEVVDYGIKKLEAFSELLDPEYDKYKHVLQTIDLLKNFE